VILDDSRDRTRQRRQRPNGRIIFFSDDEDEREIDIVEEVMNAQSDLYDSGEEILPLHDMLARMRREEQGGMLDGEDSDQPRTMANNDMYSDSEVSSSVYPTTHNVNPSYQDSEDSDARNSEEDEGHRLPQRFFFDDEAGESGESEDMESEPEMEERQSSGSSARRIIYSDSDA
jgi:hypothetical protein